MKKYQLVGFVVFVAAISAWLAVFVVGSSRFRAEREHSVRLPPSAHYIQCRGDAWRGFLDRGAATMFEMSTNDITAFLAQLHIRSRAVSTQSTGDPTVNDHNIWPKDSKTFVPTNAQYGGFRRTWRGEAVPLEVLSCSSSRGRLASRRTVEAWRQHDADQDVYGLELNITGISGRDKDEVRHKLVEAGQVDVIFAIRSNFILQPRVKLFFETTQHRIGHPPMEARSHFSGKL